MRSSPRSASILAALLLCAAGAGAQDFTLADVMSAPQPASLVAAPDGEAVAWVRNDRGVRNIWIARAPAWRGSRITSYTEDDGQELTGLEFTPDGGTIVYVRGGAPNRQGEFPNPSSDPDGAVAAIMAVPSAGGEPWELARGAGFALSPGGDRVAFTRDGIRVAEVDPGAVARPADVDAPEGRVEEPGAASTGERKLADVRGSAGSLRWAPDGSRLAFVSDRGDHAFIGVLDLASRTVRYMDPSVDSDGSPVWSPDGDRIAFTRVPNERRLLPFLPRREALPWSIRVADPVTGAGEEVWRAGEGAGSAFRTVSAENQLLWGAGDRIVFPWEREGWTHLYSVPISGGPASLLTPGSFEVQFVGLTPAGDAVIYSSNQEDIDRQHLWRIPVHGGEPVSLTGGRGVEWSPVPLGDDGLAFLASGPTTPAHAEILVDGDRRWLVPDGLPDRFPTDELVVPEQVVFSAADGLPIHGQLFPPPPRCGSGPKPGLLFFHGGSRRQMLLAFHHRGYYHNAYAFNQYMANRCYVVMSVNYRSGIGYGLEFREALRYGAGGASEFNDVLGAGLYMRQRPDVDPERIGLWGGSYGGYLTALGLARASDLFAAGVDLHGVHDWNVVIRNFVPAYRAVERKHLARLAFESSPMADIGSWRSPVLLIHGDDDRNVPFSESVDLAESLRSQGVDFEQLVFPDEVHGFLLHENWLAAYRAAADFLDRKLKVR